MATKERLTPFAQLIEFCKTLGVDQLSVRRQRILASYPHQFDACVFFTCAYEFIFAPSEAKFAGIEAVFINPIGPFGLNISQTGIKEIEKLLHPSAAVHLEGSSVSYSYTRGRAGGLYARAAANYNIQTQVLAYVACDNQGLNSQGSVESQIIPYITGRSAPAGALSGIMSGALDDMRDALSPYWGAETELLGL